MFRFKDWNNTFVIARSSHNFLNFYIDTSSQHEKKVYNQTQRHESSVGYSFLEKGDGIKLEKNSIHFRGFLLYLKNERVIDLQTQNTTICNYCGRLVPLLWSSLKCAWKLKYCIPPFHFIPNFPNGLTKQQGRLQYFHFCLFSFTYFSIIKTSQMKLHNIIFTNICELLYELENKAHHKQLPNVHEIKTL